MSSLFKSSRAATGYRLRRQVQISSTPQAWISSGCSAAGFRSLWCTAQISRVHWGKQKAHAPRKGENRLRLCEKTHSARSVKSENAPPARRVRNGKPRRTFVLRGLFTLAAIYSRGTCRPTTIDVLMFHFRVRNGSGWGHQAMTTRFQEAVGLLCLSGNHFCAGALCFSAADWHPRGVPGFLFSNVLCVFPL